jgi:RNA polymerase sigma-70 factor (ECF subfamily)
VFDENLPCTDEKAAAAWSPEGKSIQDELRGLLEKAVDSLPPLYKASFLLVADQGLSHAEAAQVLGCSENTVSWRMHKARKLLRSRLEPYLKEAGS